MNFLKKLGKKFLTNILEKQVIELRSKNNFKIVAVVGSVGKTSTKISIAKVLGADMNVRYQTGNYNDHLTVPLVIFGHENPGVFNVLAWIKIILNNKKQIKNPFPYDVVVVELGTDGPGQIEQFAYLSPDLTVVSAVTPEHMEFFETLDNVAEEELAVKDYSKKLLINTDDTPKKNLKNVKNYISYGLKPGCDYKGQFTRISNLANQELIIHNAGKKQKVKISLLGEQGAKVALASYATAIELGVDPKKALKAVSELKAFQGRMQLLDGIKNSKIIDDSYNSSPSAVYAALDVLYGVDAPQKIAILGNMNELGNLSQKLHEDVGKYCDPKALDIVITIGSDANKYTAKVAKKLGCNVETFDSPYEAGDFVKSKIKKEAVVLVKGSQNRVFAEEAIKSFLAKAGDKDRLVRQSDFWLNIKKQQFGRN